jgi:antitoxin YefM
MKEISFTNMQKNMASVLDRVAANGKVVAVRKGGKRLVFLVPPDVFTGLMETEHLLGSPKNARRLLGALSRTGSAKLRF